MKAHEIIRMTEAEFLALPEYSCSQPTGVWPGKRWRRLDGSHDRAFLKAGGQPRWLVCQYTAAADPRMCRTVMRVPHIQVRAAT